MSVSPKQFLDSIDDAQVVAAIAKAENTTSAEIRVFVSSHAANDPVIAARGHFKRLKMDRTQHRNGVLVFIAPLSRRFAVVADTAAHEKCGQATWDRLAGELATHFRDANFTAGLTHVIAELGRALATPFPPDASNPDELPNDVERD